jgi:hypothetical protein
VGDTDDTSKNCAHLIDNKKIRWAISTPYKI